MPELSWPIQAHPRIRTAGRFQHADRDFSVDYRGPTHAIHLYDYEATFRLEGRSYHLRPGDLTCTPAGCPSAYHLPRPGRHWCVHVLPEEGPQPVRLPAHVRLPLPARQRVAEAILRMSGFRAAAAETPGTADIAQAAAAATCQALFLDIALVAAGGTQIRHQDSRTIGALRLAAEVLTAQATSAVDLDAVATKAGLSRPWLARAFRAQHGVSMQRWHLQQRIEHARVLLRTTGLAVGEIARRLGFLDAQHLNKQFRRIAGCSPTAFRAWSARNDA